MGGSVPFSSKGCATCRKRKVKVSSPSCRRCLTIQIFTNTPLWSSVTSRSQSVEGALNVGWSVRGIYKATTFLLTTVPPVDRRSRRMAQRPRYRWSNGLNYFHGRLRDIPKFGCNSTHHLWTHITPRAWTWRLSERLIYSSSSCRASFICQKGQLC